jgi:molecular chaperone Hsp33
MSQMLQEDPSVIDVRSFYVRHRNALMVQSRFGPMYMDYYLHLMNHSIKHEEMLDSKLKNALAAMTLHLCSRPQDETVAWTVNFHRPLMNLFVTGNTRPGMVTGRIFTEDVKDSGHGLFIAQVNRPHVQPRQSMVEVQGNDVLEMVEHFYSQSEQRMTRFFIGPDEEFTMLSAEPDCDEDWLIALAPDEVPKLFETEHLTPLETRQYSFGCGCHIERLFPLITRLSEDDLEHIFADGVAVITCPRCAAVYKASKDQFEEWRNRQK